MSTREREYELILFGATGYTGLYCAEHIATHLPTDLRWAVAGRSAPKLSAVIDEIKSLNPDRLEPGLEVSSLTSEDLNALAKKTRLLINTVGPYHLYSTPVVEACAKNGTHYVDATGESPWVLEMIRKYHDIAKDNNAIIIHGTAPESAASDLLVWVLVSLIRDKLNVGTKDIIGTVHEMKARPSGGTLASLMSILDHYTLSQIVESSRAWVMSPIPGPKPLAPRSLSSKLSGVQTVPDLGTLTTGLASGVNSATVQRSWGLQDQGNFYGRRFQYHEYMTVRNAFTGIVVHVALTLGIIALTFPPLRWLLKKIIPAPGTGPTREAARKECLEHRAIATADQDVPGPQRAFARLRWNGSLYQLTGVFLAEAAMVILRHDMVTKSLGGGLLTPAMLGQPYVDRLRSAGLTIESHLMD